MSEPSVKLPVLDAMGYSCILDQKAFHGSHSATKYIVIICITDPSSAAIVSKEINIFQDPYTSSRDQQVHSNGIHCEHSSLKDGSKTQSGKT